VQIFLQNFINSLNKTYRHKTTKHPFEMGTGLLMSHIPTRKQFKSKLTLQQKPQMKTLHLQHTIKIIPYPRIFLHNPAYPPRLYAILIMLQMISFLNTKFYSPRNHHFFRKVSFLKSNSDFQLYQTSLLRPRIFEKFRCHQVALKLQS
jgi:hypothetical protein